MARTPSNRNRRQDRRSRPALVRLEGRQLMAAGISNIINGAVTITGTEQADTIKIQYLTGTPWVRMTVETGGQTTADRYFDWAAVSRVEVNALGGNDRVENTSILPSWLNGGEGNDTLVGGWGDDVLDGGNGNDRLEGRTGDDTLAGYNGNDTYAFGSGSNLGRDTIIEQVGSEADTLDFSQYEHTVNLDLNQTARQDVLPYFPGDDIKPAPLSLRLSTSTGVENVIGSPQKDLILGNSRANRLEGRNGNDVLDGRFGNDTLVGGLGDDTYAFASLTDHRGTDEVVEVAGQGRDTLDFSQMSGGVDVDLGSTATRAVSPLQTLRLSSGGAIEDVVGSNHNDTIRGNNLANTLRGGTGNDTLEGRQGDDQLYGQGGDDTYAFNADASGQDSLFEDEDNHGPTNDSRDRLNFTNHGARITLDLSRTELQQVTTAGSTNLRLRLASATGFEDVIGTALADQIAGNSRNNILSGLAGNDTISGSAGDDTLYGGDNNDRLDGDEGYDLVYGQGGNDILRGGMDGISDWLEGGAGADTFVAEWYYINRQEKRNRENVRDLLASQGDVLA